jgi:transcriptional regulator with XRE-family HTH domain
VSSLAAPLATVGTIATALGEEPPELRERRGMTIAEIREAHGLSQHEFANRLRVGAGTVRDWEHGIHHPGRRYRLRIAAVFGVAPEAIGVRGALGVEPWELRDEHR